MAREDILCVFMLMMLRNGCAQNDTSMVMMMPPHITTPSPVESDVICSACACAPGVVNCKNSNLTAPFKLWDWAAISTLKPTKVDLSGNNIRSITRFAELDIRYLNLSSCGIDSIEDASFQYLQNLTSLDLSRNDIATNGLNKKIFAGRLLPDITPTPFNSLHHLSLAYNDIHSLPQDLFISTPRISQLDLSGNPLAYIDQVTMGAISDLVGLEELYLARCELESLPEGLLRRQRRLRKLDLSDNRFTTLPSVLQESVNLVYLNFDRNSVTTLDSNTAALTLPNLQELSVSRLSKLQNVTKSSLGGMQNLAVLRMSHNPRLTYLDPYFLMAVNEDGEEQWPLIKELYLKNNNISTIDPHMLDNWSSLEKADFSNNPYVCDCANQWMVDVLIPLVLSTQSNATVSGMVCKKPAEVRGLSFSQLHSSSRSLTCPETATSTQQPSSKKAVILGFMIGIMMTFPLVMVLMLLWKRGHFARCRSRKVDEGYFADEIENL